VESEDDTSGAEQRSRAWITRLLPAGVRFEGRIHEQAVSPLPRVDLPVHLGHDGYRAAQRTGKRARNRPLLLAELAAHPGDAYLMLQLGRDAEAAGDRARPAAGTNRRWPPRRRRALAPRSHGALLHCLANPAAGARHWRWPTG
jgi:hypothetical protein